MTDESKPVASLKIQIDNDIKSQDVSKVADDDDDIEEGETSFEDEVEVNVIVQDHQLNVNSFKEHPSPLKNKKEKTSLYKVKKSFHDGEFTDQSSHKSFYNDSYDPFIMQMDSDVLKERAKRFGVESSKQNVSVPLESIHSIYRSLDLTKDDFDRGGWRADAIHVRGFKHGESSQVFKYFKDYSPLSIEWLSRNSCNVVCKDHQYAMKAIHELSCPIKPSKNTKIKSRESDKMRKQKSKPLTKAGTLALKKKIRLEQKQSKGKTDEAMDYSDDGNEDGSSSSSSSSSSSESDSSSDSESSSDSGSSSSSNTSSSSDSSSSSNDSSSEDEDEKPDKNAKKSHSSATVDTSVLDKTHNIEQETSSMVVDQALEDKDIDFVLPEDVGVTIPPGRWRLGVPCPHTKAVLMRFAHCKDKRTPGLEKPIEFYEDYLSKKMAMKERLGIKPRMKSWIDNGDQNSLPTRGMMRPIVARRPERDWDLPEPPSELPFYKDLDDPVGEDRNPWGFLSRNWNRKETQDNIDYQDLLKQHLIVRKRKHYSSDSEREEEYASRATKRHRSSKKSRSKKDYTSRSQMTSSRRRRNSHGDDDEDEEYDAGSLEEDRSGDFEDFKSRSKAPMLGMYADMEERKRDKRWRERSKSSRYGPSRPPREKRPSIRAPIDLREKLEGRKHVF